MEKFFSVDSPDTFKLELLLTSVRTFCEDLELIAAKIATGSVKLSVYAEKKSPNVILAV